MYSTSQITISSHKHLHTITLSILQIWAYISFLSYSYLWVCILYHNVKLLIHPRDNQWGSLSDHTIFLQGNFHIVVFAWMRVCCSSEKYAFHAPEIRCIGGFQSLIVSLFEICLWSNDVIQMADKICWNFQVFRSSPGMIHFRTLPIKYFFKCVTSDSIIPTISMMTCGILLLAVSAQKQS